MAKVKTKGSTFEDFEASFREKKFAPLYLFFGEETLLIDEITRMLVDHAVEEATKSFNLDVVYGSDVSGKDIAGMASSFPMMGERRVVLVREFDKTVNKESLLPYFERPSASTVLALLSVKPDFRNKVFKTLKDVATIGEFRQLYENEVPAWVVKRVQRMDKKITPDAAQLIHTYVGRSLRDIQNEIEKLCIYIGEKTTIESDDVNRVVGLSRQFNIFELQKTIGQQKLAHAVGILEKMLQAGESPIGIVVMLTRYFQKLWLAQELLSQRQTEYEVAASLGMSPIFVKELTNAAQRYSSTHVQYCFFRLKEADAALKSSGMEARTVMTVLICGLIRGDGIAT